MASTMMLPTSRMKSDKSTRTRIRATSRGSLYAHKDPLEVARRELMEQGWLDEQEDASLQAEVRDFVQKAFAQAQREATPNPQSMDWSAVSWKPVRT